MLLVYGLVFDRFCPHNARIIDIEGVVNYREIPYYFTGRFSICIKSCNPSVDVTDPNQYNVYAFYTPLALLSTSL